MAKEETETMRQKLDEGLDNIRSLLNFRVSKILLRTFYHTASVIITKTKKINKPNRNSRNAYKNTTIPRFKLRF